MGKNNPFNPFVSRKHEIHLQDNWDTDYISLEFKDIVKKTGEGDEDYVLVTKTIINKEPIDEVVARDSGTCSVRDIMEKVIRTGDQSLIPAGMPKDGITNDYTHVPDNLLDLDNLNKEMAAKFEALPDELKKGRSFAEFCELINQDEFMQFIASIAPKKEAKKDGD